MDKFVDKLKALMHNRKTEALMALMVLILVLGISYAWIRKTYNSNNKNVLMAGKLRLEILNEDPIIRAGGENGYAIPMEDAIGLTTKPYTFTIKNTGNIDASFEITLEDATSYTETYSEEDQYGYSVTGQREQQIAYSSQRIPDNKIRFNIGESVYAEDGVSTLSEVDRVILSGTIAPRETKTYYLRLWIDINATTSDIDGRTFAANLSINAIQYGGQAGYGYANAGNRNLHIKAVYEYNQNGTGTGAEYAGCLGGAEAGCVDVKSSYTSSSTYAPGTIIKYEVKAGVEKYFNVIHDDGSTLTLQERQNTVSNVTWGTSVSAGPALTSGYALYSLEQATNDWTYVNTQTYSIGDGNTTLGYSGCLDYNVCNDTRYTLTRTAKARMITIQELYALDCRYGQNGCKKFVYNYLNGATVVSGYSTVESIGTYATDANYMYWTMTAFTSSQVWSLLSGGAVYPYNGLNENAGARAVVAINK